MNGWAGQRLRVDLTTGKITKEPHSYEYRRKWIGGRGYNSDVIYNEVPANLDPYDPKARVCFGVGPVSGTAAPSTGRVTVTAKSPLTGGFGDSTWVVTGEQSLNMLVMIRLLYRVEQKNLYISGLMMTK